MAEGFLRNLGVDVKSAGVESHGLNTYAVQVMREVNIDISANISQKIHTLNLSSFEILITVCDHAKDNCPYFQNATKRISYSFNDPADATGTDEEKLKVYKKVRDQIQQFCIHFCEKEFDLH